MSRLLYIAAVLVLAGAQPAVAAGTRTFHAQNGAVLPMPEIGSIDCSAMGRLLLQFTNSDYRGNVPVPEEHPDRPAYEYEHRLAALYFRRCQAMRSYYQNTAPVFAKGFE